MRADGRKELVAVGDGFRESTESWAEVLRDLRRRGMHAPMLAIGDGALGFRGALREVFPKTREQRCWVHKIANVLDVVPSSLRPKVKAARHNIMHAENKEAADLALDRFKETGALDPLTHHERIESTFATVRLRTNKTKGAGSPSAGLAMAYELLDAAQARWRCVNAPRSASVWRRERR